MVVQAARINRPAISAFASVALWTLVFPAVALADPLGAGDGAIYMMTPKAAYQEGCFPPCMCPIMIEQPITGTFKLVYKGLDSTGLNTYAVEDVNWTVPFFDPPLRITGSGKYSIGSPGILTVMEQRMELDLHVGANAVEHFDSGWVHIGDMSRINVTVSIHGMFCYDRVVTIDADRADGQVTPYTLASGATYERGCCSPFSPCDCLCLGPVPMVGDFALVFLNDNSLFREYAVVDVRWQIPSTGSTNGIPIRGFGFYRVGGEVAVQHQLDLELWLSNTGPTHFDSGFVVGGGQFPVIDISVSRTAMDPTACTDTILHVVGKPVIGGAICGGIAGIPCQAGEFCKLAVGACCCDFQGICTPIPAACPDVWAPVCGCDGVTYGNECEADRAGVTIAYLGPCGQLCFGDSDCSSTTRFCKFPAGTCGAIGSAGMCVERPTACPMVWMPVCGCDGRTYGNECEADAAGISLAHRGPCEVGACCADEGGSPLPVPVCAEITADQCQGGIFQGPGTTCEPTEACCMPLANNACVDISRFCCEAFGGIPKALGSSCVDPTGANVCGRICGGFTGYRCEPGEFCKFPDGICSDATDHTGVCTPIPNACPEVYDPVCGCDGVTYGNACEADRAAVSVKHPGVCLPAVCAASRVLSDPEPTYCPGSRKLVRIVLTPPNTAQVLGVEDSPPRGWIVTSNISHGGGYDPVNGKVKWGPLFPPFPAALTYEVIPTEVAGVPPCFSGQISVNGGLEPICGDMCLALFCCPRMEADEPRPACNMCRVGDCSSCGAGACENGQVTLCEVIGYACSWMRGCNDDLSGMTRAAFVWRSGECYCWDDGRKKWMATSCPAPDSGCCPSSTPSSSGGSAAVEVSVRVIDVPSTLGAVRDKAVHAWNIPVTIEAPSGTTAAALEVQVPAGWVVTTMSDDGAWDAAHRKIKWGPFFDDLSRTVMFQVRPAVESDGGKPRTLRGGLRSIGLSGTVSFDGVNHAIAVR